MKKEKFAKVLRIAKLAVYPVMALAAFASYFASGDKWSLILMWIAIIGMEVMIQGKKEVDVTIFLRDENKGNNALESEIQETTDENHRLDLLVTEYKNKVKELKKEIEHWKDYAGESQRHIDNRDKEIERLKNESVIISQAKDSRIRQLTDELNDLRTLKSVNVDTATRLHDSGEILSMILDGGAINADFISAPETTLVEILPSPKQEAILEVIHESETVKQPDFNHTAVEATEEATPGKEPSKKKNQKWHAEHFTRYIEMIKTGSSRDAVIEKMIEDLHVSKTTGMALYYKWVKSSAPIPELVKHVPPPPEPKINKATPVERELEAKPAPPKSKPTPRISSLPAPILKKLDAMPEYPTVIQFKDAVCMMHEMSQYSVAQLKLAYKETHKNLTW